MQKTFSITLLTAAAISITSGASALQIFHEYRIRGSEIGSVEAPDPEFEDPFTLEIMINRSDTGIFIQSDENLSECAERIQGIIGSEDEYVQIIEDANAETMNGVLVISCSIFSFF